MGMSVYYEKGGFLWGKAIKDQGKESFLGGHSAKKGPKRRKKNRQRMNPDRMGHWSRLSSNRVATDLSKDTIPGSSPAPLGR